MNEVDAYKGSVGTVITLSSELDLTGATSVSIVAKKPGLNRNVVTWDATIVDGSIVYTTEEGDLSVAGTWLLQPYIVMSSWSGPGEPVEFVVGPAI